MFKFGFTYDDEKEKGNVAEEESESSQSLDWFPAERIEITEKELSRNFEEDDFKDSELFNDLTLKLIYPDKVVIALQHDNCENIIEAESQHSDLVPAKYEGGLKVWECSYDLIKYLLNEKVSFSDKMVLDLGCGAGIVGLLALLKGSNVHFQDYNAEVIKSVTIPNVILNAVDRKSLKERCEFFSGDWASFEELTNETETNGFKKYDIILTSETIYNPDNQKKLYNIFKSKLKSNGAAYVAGKVYYFGVGGGMRQFEDLVKKEKIFDTETVWKSDEAGNIEADFQELRYGVKTNRIPANSILQFVDIDYAVISKTVNGTKLGVTRSRNN